MEFETVSLIKKEDPKRSAEAVANEFLEQEASDWFRCFSEFCRRKGIAIKSLRMPWKRSEIVRHLPTDLITYFVYRLEPNISQEIADVVMDGRVHLILILSRTDLPNNEDWHKNLAKIPIGTYQKIGALLIPKEDGGDHTAESQVHIHEMNGYSRDDMNDIIAQLAERKSHYEYDKR